MTPGSLSPTARRYLAGMLLVACGDDAPLPPELRHLIESVGPQSRHFAFARAVLARDSHGAKETVPRQERADASAAVRVFGGYINSARNLLKA